MKKITILALSALLAFPLVAGELEWLTDLDKAKALAKKEHKVVLLDFTGSDWCPPCKNLHSTVLTSPEFAEYAKKNAVLVELDFPRSKPQSAELKAANQQLMKEFGIRGYPTIIVIDADGKKLFEQVGYSGTPAKDYVAKLPKAPKS